MSRQDSKKPKLTETQIKYREEEGRTIIYCNIPEGIERGTPFRVIYTERQTGRVKKLAIIVQYEDLIIENDGKLEIIIYDKLNKERPQYFTKLTKNGKGQYLININEDTFNFLYPEKEYNSQISSLPMYLPFNELVLNALAKENSQQRSGSSGLRHLEVEGVTTEQLSKAVASLAMLSVHHLQESRERGEGTVNSARQRRRVRSLRPRLSSPPPEMLTTNTNLSSLALFRIKSTGIEFHTQIDGTKKCFIVKRNEFNGIVSQEKLNLKQIFSGQEEYRDKRKEVIDLITQDKSSLDGIVKNCEEEVRKDIFAEINVAEKILESLSVISDITTNIDKIKKEIEIILCLVKNVDIEENSPSLALISSTITDVLANKNIDEELMDEILDCLYQEFNELTSIFLNSVLKKISELNESEEFRELKNHNIMILSKIIAKFYDDLSMNNIREITSDADTQLLLQEHLLKFANGRLKRLEDENKELKTRNEEQERTLSDLAVGIEGTESEYNDQITSLQEEISRLEKELSVLKNQNSRLSTRLKRKDNAPDKKSKKLSQHHSRLEFNIAELSDQVSDLRSINLELEGTIRVLKRTITDLKQKD